MGAGIAQLAARAGARTLVHDPDPDALARGIESARARLVKKGDDAAAARLEAAPDVAGLAACGLTAR